MNGIGEAVDVIDQKIEELRVKIYDAEPGSLAVDSHTLQVLDFYLHLLPRTQQYRWLDEHGDALKKAVFG